MWARWSTFLVWALVAASGVFWGLKLWASPLAAPPQTVLAQGTPAAGGDWSRLFGAAPPPPPMAAAPAPPPESSRFQLIGVVAPRAAAAHAQGVALIAVDGKPPRAYRVGAAVDGDHVLQSVRARAVTLGPRQGPATIALELPPLQPPATGVPAAAGVVPGGPGVLPPPVVTPGTAIGGVRGFRPPGTVAPAAAEDPARLQMQHVEPAPPDGNHPVNPAGQASPLSQR
ncbi:MAG: type II secretion system protein N [Rubrivivax sp.]